MKIIDNIKQNHAEKTAKRDEKRKKRGYKKISKFKVLVFIALFAYMIYFVATEIYYIDAYFTLLDNDYNATGLTSPIIFNFGVILFFVLSFAFRHSKKELYKKFAWYMVLCMCMIILTYAMFQPSNFFDVILQGLWSMAPPLILGVLLALDEPKWLKRITSKIKQKVRSNSTVKRITARFDKKKKWSVNEKPKGNVTKKEQNSKRTKTQKGKSQKTKKAKETVA